MNDFDIDVLMLNEIEREVNTFNPALVSIAYDRCLPILPDSFFNDLANKQQFIDFLTDYFGF